jgi:hypothetical protein
MLDFGWVQDSVANHNPENEDRDGNRDDCRHELGGHLIGQNNNVVTARAKLWESSLVYSVLKTKVE